MTMKQSEYDFLVSENERREDEKRYYRKLKKTEKTKKILKKILCFSFKKS